MFDFGEGYFMFKIVYYQNAIGSALDWKVVSVE